MTNETIDTAALATRIADDLDTLDVGAVIKPPILVRTEAEARALAALLRGVVWQPIETAEGWIKITCVDDLPKKPGIKPYEYVECLIMHKGEIKLRPWNCEHLCWDDEDYDDFYCDAMEPSHWMPLPAPPPTSKEG